jgi:hypothetical protein
MHQDYKLMHFTSNHVNGHANGGIDTYVFEWLQY